MKQVLLFGAGKSATFLIDYLLENAKNEDWFLTVVDADLAVAEQKINNNSSAKAMSFDINIDELRYELIATADIVISMLPPSLHFLVAGDCLQIGKNLLTASYVDDNLREMQNKILDKNIIFLCEMGLDPGIDHMSAMKIIDEIHSSGGRITSFKSHCGGLVAPESDDNPWHYKISWNPKNIVMAGKAGAIYKEEGKIKENNYQQVFSGENQVNVPGLNNLSWYPNRDSLSYIPLYGLETANTFIRTTLRHPDFMFGWNNVVNLFLTNEVEYINTDGLTFAAFFKQHFEKHGFSKWVEEQLAMRFEQTKSMLGNLMKLKEAEQEAEVIGEKIPDSIMMVNEKGTLDKFEREEIKASAAGVMAHKMHEANLLLKQLFFLGMDDKKTIINKGKCSAAEVLQFLLEKKLALLPGNKDMIVMMHEIEFENDGKKIWINSSLVVKGDDHIHTAMAKTVGLPLGIAAKLILNGTIQLKGLHIPTNKEIYQPVLKELETLGIKFKEEKN